MDRRKFLGMASASVLFTACGGGGSGGGNTDPDTGPTQLEWLNFAEEIAGTVIRPGTSNYDQIRRVFNSRYDAIKPAAIIRCNNTQDIQRSLAFAKLHELPLVPRSGGHGYAGYSTTPGVVIDLSSMSNISIGEGTATIGAGAKLVDIYDQLTAEGVAIPAGSCPTVGIGGLTQGGGIGIVDRAYGLTCDNLLSAKIVLADGSVVTCNEENEPDLFWALRGGGGGNFGIVTEFTFKTHSSESDITTLEAYFDFDDFVDVMSAWQAWPETLPNNIWAQIIPGWGAPSSKPSLYLRVFAITDQEGLAPYWEDFLEAADVTPTWTNQVTNSYRDTMLGTCGSFTIPECHVQGYTPQGKISRNAFAASSDFFHEPVSEAGLLALKQAILDSQVDGNYGMMILDLMRGVIDEIAADKTAFIHRGALFSAEYYTWYPVGTANATVDKAQTWVNSFRDVMEPWSSGGAYVNYIDPLIENWAEAYYGDNYTRLQQVKATYDPDWFFKIPQGVRPGS